MDTVNRSQLKVIDGNNLRPIRDVTAVDQIMWAYKTKSFWEFVDEVFKVWEVINPGQWRELIHEVEITRENLKDKKYATTGAKDKERRFLLRMPEFIHNTIWKLYPDYPMDRKFYNTFAKRYPKFRVSDKI